MSKLKVFKGVAQSAVAAIVALTGTMVAQPEWHTKNEEQYEMVGATADEVFNYALQFEGMKREEFREKGWEPNYSAWCAWYASQMLIDCNVPFPEQLFDARIWVTDILAGYIQEGRYIHTSENTSGFFSDYRGTEVSTEMLRECQNVNYTPQHGDLLFFDWNYDGRPDHIGFVDYVADDGRVHTLEGNPGDMPATETKVSRLTKSKAFIIGYAKPAYITTVPKPNGNVPPYDVNDGTSEPSESATPKTLTVTFDAGEGAFCDEQQREITWGTCSYNFPTPYKGTENEFLGWFDDAGNEVNCDSIITDNIVLYAKWKECKTAASIAPLITSRAEETTKITVQAEVYSVPNIEPTESKSFIEPETQMPDTSPFCVTSQSTATCTTTVQPVKYTQPTEKQLIESERKYYLIPLSNESTCISASCGYDNGANVTAESIDRGYEQMWTFEKVGENRYYIVNVGSKKLLNMHRWTIDDVRESGNFTNISVWERTNDPTQAFSICPYTSFGDDVVVIKAADIPTLRVDVYGTIDRNNGRTETPAKANIQLYEATENENIITQLFRLVPID